MSPKRIAGACITVGCCTSCYRWRVFDQILPRAVHRRLPELYVALALITGSLLCLLTPSFYVPDELQHTFRAIQISRGQTLAPVRTDARQGDMDASLRQVADGTLAVEEHTPGVKAGWLPFERLPVLATVRWSDRTVPERFQNTVVYPPQFYVVQSAAWRIAHARGFTIVHSLWLVRFAQLACSVFLGWLALAVCRCGRLLVFALLLIPTALSVNASASQDAVCFAVSALAMAIVTRALADRRLLHTWELVSVTLLMALSITARPPYLPLAIVLLLPAWNLGALTRRTLAAPVASMAAIVSALAAWNRFTHRFGLAFLPPADPAAQVHYILSHPIAALGKITLGSLRAGAPVIFYGPMFLGTNHVHGPLFLHIVFALAIAGLLLTAGPPCLQRPLPRAAILVATAIIVCGIAVVEYIIWNPVGGSTVEGMQTRYYLPLMPWVFLALAPSGWLTQQRRRQVATASIAVFVLCVLSTPWVAAHAFYHAGVTASVRAILH